MPDVRVAVARFSTPTSTGNQDWTTTDLGGATPKAARFIWSYAQSDGAAQAHMGYAIGFTDGTTSKTAWASAEDAVTTTNTDDSLGVSGANDHCIWTAAPGASGTPRAVADFVSFITNGVRLNFTGVHTSAELVYVEFYAGDDLSAFVDNFTTSTLDTEVNVTAPGFEPDLVHTLLAYVIANVQYSWGYWVNNGADTQGSFWDFDRDANATVDSRGLISDSYALATNDVAIEITSPDAAGFSVYARTTAGANKNGFYLALNFGGLAVDGGALDSPTSTGNVSYSSLSFQPQAVGMIGSMMTAYDTQTSDGTGSTFFISGFTPDAEFCTAVASEDAVATTNAQSLSDDTAIHLTDDAGAQTHLASRVSMNVNGWTLNYAAADGTARKWLWYAIEAPAAASENILLGGTPVSAIYHGSNPITAVYHGSTQIWP